MIIIIYFLRYAVGVTKTIRLENAYDSGCLVGTRRDCINAKSVYGVEHNQMKPFTFSSQHERR